VTFVAETADWRLIGLDSHIPGEVSGRLDAAQLDWLRCELDNHGAMQTALFLHHPPIPIGSVWMDKIRLQNGDELVDLIRQAPQVRFVCCGHLHHEYRASIEHAAFFITPATSVQFDPAGNQTTVSNQPPGYRIFELDTDNFRSHVVRLAEGKYVPHN
jgi:Icc protein